jgi:hypothetical protein
VPITPDTKDWTWAAERACDECGFDPTTLAVADIAPTLRRTAQRWVQFLDQPRPWTTRPDDGTWSPLEYAAHVRDVIRLYDERLRLMLETDDPLYANWDQDEAAAGYLDEQPAAVSAEISRDAAALADRFDDVQDWERPGRRSDGARFTVASFGRYFLHDLIHHLHDVGG